MSATHDLSPTAAAALHRVVAERGATIHPSTKLALHTRGMVHMPFWNQPNYVRATSYGVAHSRKLRSAEEN